MVVVSRFAPRRVGLAVFAWAIAVDFLVFLGRTTHHLGISSGTSTLAYWLAVGLTAIVGFWLGWRRRTGTAFVVPMLSWCVLVPFAFVSEIIRRGFLSGVLWGFGFTIVGGFVASTIEAALLVMFAVLGRAAVGSHGGSRTTVILPPRTG